MQEFPVNLKLAGLSPNPGDPGAEVLLGMRPHKGGYESVLAPRLLVALAASWPFPQIFKLLDYTIVATVDSFYDVAGNLILGPVATAGYPWSAAIAGDFIIFTNNKVVVSGRGLDLSIDTTGLVPAGRSICEVGAQFVIGAPWAYAANHTKAVIWSRVGVADFTIDEDNISALRFAGCGDVLAVKPYIRPTISGIRRGFIAYGTEGVTAFDVESAPAGYSQVQLSDVGIYSQLAVAGTLRTHFFVGTNRRLYAISEGKLEELGFERQFRLAGGEISLSFNRERNELWAGF